MAEHATGHPDNTFSMLRAGLNQITGAAPPFTLNATLVARIVTDLVDRGDHQFDVRCMDEDGADVLPTLEGQFTGPPQGGNINLILGLALGFPHPGRYVFCLRIDNVEVDRWNIAVLQTGQDDGEEEKEEKEENNDDD